MTLEELKQYENSKITNNPYFRKKIDNWRDKMLILLNEELKNIEPDDMLLITNAVNDYMRIIVKPNESLQSLVNKKLEKLTNYFEVKTDIILPFQSDY